MENYNIKEWFFLMPIEEKKNEEKKKAIKWKVPTPPLRFRDGAPPIRPKSKNFLRG